VRGRIRTASGLRGRSGAPGPLAGARPSPVASSCAAALKRSSTPPTLLWWTDRPTRHLEGEAITSIRSVLVEPRRLEGWLSRFEERNGAFSLDVIPATDPAHIPSRATGDADPDRGSLRIVAVNGCSAVLVPPLPVTYPAGPAGAAGAADALIAHLSVLTAGTTVGLLLLRRGGYSVGVARAGEVLASKTGTRYVQGRTAAGGWSQQRFARRRANQADALVEETAVRAAAVFAAHPPSCLQLGGDRAMASAVLGENALARFAGLPRTPFLTVPDPRLTVLKDAARSALSVRITVTDPPDTA
jgi:hypothetical protein